MVNDDDTDWAVHDAALPPDVRKVFDLPIALPDFWGYAPGKLGAKPRILWLTPVRQSLTAHQAAKPQASCCYETQHARDAAGNLADGAR